jgi:cell division protease FtsH
MFVGVGASRVKSLFQEARNSKPCVIFIDEIDAVGKKRSSSAFTMNDEREQTLNQLLYEMDGFNNNDDILVMAATNRRDTLDEALLRPGRFDRIISVPLPDFASRRQILSSFFKIYKVDPSVSVDLLVDLTEGFSGAQLKNLMNEAAIFAVRGKKGMIGEIECMDAYEKQLVGLVKKNAVVSESVRRRVATHECGHALLVLLFSSDFVFQKVSIWPTYGGAGGYTLFKEKRDSESLSKDLYTRAFLKKRLIIMMGGKAAESVIYGDEEVSLGSNQDLRQAAELARNMVQRFGLGSGDLQTLYVDSDIQSEYTKERVDKEISMLVQEAYLEARNLLLKNREKLTEMTANVLLNHVVTEFY